MIGGLSGVDVAMWGAAGAAVVFAVVYALARGDRLDPIERLAAWARASGLEYVPGESERLLASFVGERDGRRVEVKVERVGRGFGEDLPTRFTTVTAGAVPDGADSAHQVAALCVVQPATWVLDRDGHEAREPVPTGDAAFDARWSARGPDAGAAARCVPAGVRARLLQSDAEGLIVEFFPTAVAIPMPGVGADARELDRRLALAVDLRAAQMD